MAVSLLYENVSIQEVARVVTHPCQASPALFAGGGGLVKPQPRLARGNLFSMVTIGIERLHGILVGADIGPCGFGRKSRACRN
jgi:hypothetical protein